MPRDGVHIIQRGSSVRLVVIGRRKRGVRYVGILTWILIGLVAGVVAKLIMGDSLGWIMTIVLGIVGAFVGGWVSGLFGGPGVSGFDIPSLLVATLGAVIVLFVYGLISRRR
jgi:uncharacterized membrane protein YeaQ/YmgE (transglycosylase-associated protein family)